MRRLIGIGAIVAVAAIATAGCGGAAPVPRQPAPDPERTQVMRSIRRSRHTTGGPR
jgi:hypothetical protein